MSGAEKTVGMTMMCEVLQLDKGDYSKHLHVVFCPNKQRYFEPFMCLDLV